MMHDSSESTDRRQQDRPKQDQSEQPDQRVAAPKGRVRRMIRKIRPRFRLMDMLWLAVVSAILILWYQDHERLANQLMSRNTRTNWSVRQVLGKPNTPSPGDQTTAWASQSQDTALEWLIVEFPNAVRATKVQIEETYNPGAVNRVCSVDWRGKETELWKGKDPTPPGAAMGSSIINFTSPINTRRLKIYIDSPAIQGWNEIDAVAIHDVNNQVQWASDAWASSCYGDNQELPEWFWP